MKNRNRKGQFSYADVERRSREDQQAFRAAEAALVAGMPAPVVEVHAADNRREREIA